MNHVLAELFGAGVGIVVGTRPVDGSVFGDDLVLAFACNRDRRNVGVTKNAVAILRAAGQLNYFQAAAQIYVEALLLGFAVERRGAVNQRMGGIDQRVVFVVGKAEAFGGEFSAKDGDAGIEILEKFRELQMQLE